MTPGAQLGLAVNRLEDELSDLLGRPVDLVSKRSLHPFSARRCWPRRRRFVRRDAILRPRASTPPLPNEVTTTSRRVPSRRRRPAAVTPGEPQLLGDDIGDAEFGAFSITFPCSPGHPTCDPRPRRLEMQTTAAARLSRASHARPTFSSVTEFRVVATGLLSEGPVVLPDGRVSVVEVRGGVITAVDVESGRKEVGQGALGGPHEPA